MDEPIENAQLSNTGENELPYTLVVDETLHFSNRPDITQKERARTPGVILREAMQQIFIQAGIQDFEWGARTTDFFLNPFNGALFKKSVNASGQIYSGLAKISARYIDQLTLNLVEVGTDPLSPIDGSARNFKLTVSGNIKPQQPNEAERIFSRVINMSVMTINGVTSVGITNFSTSPTVINAAADVKRIGESKHRGLHNKYERSGRRHSHGHGQFLLYNDEPNSYDGDEF